MYSHADNFMDTFRIKKKPIVMTDFSVYANFLKFTLFVLLDFDI